MKIVTSLSPALPCEETDGVPNVNPEFPPVVLERGSSVKDLAEMARQMEQAAARYRLIND